MAQVSESQTRMVSGANVGLAFLHDVEMGVEGRRLEHLRKGQLHFVGKGRQMRGRNLVVSVLDQMQMLDQQVAPPRPVAQQKRNLFSSLRVDLAALRRRFGAPPPLARMLERADLLHVMTHRNISFPHPCPAISNPWHTKCQEERNA